MPAVEECHSTTYSMSGTGILWFVVDTSITQLLRQGSSDNCRSASILQRPDRIIWVPLSSGSAISSWCVVSLKRYQSKKEEQPYNLYRADVAGEVFEHLHFKFFGRNLGERVTEPSSGLCTWVRFLTLTVSFYQELINTLHWLVITHYLLRCQLQTFSVFLNSMKL